ncbi:TRI27 protein, partial [Rhinopomastus cyanomelas]|nr:TRI27 protein [Rhinopomastus cyanomelas]
MAAPTPTQILHGETSCSICLGYFQEPVSIHCGHNFCRSCISRCWAGLEEQFSCPRCRQAASRQSLRPSWELASIAQAARELPWLAAGAARGLEGWCSRHQEARKLFCREDQQPICVVCDRSRSHRGHTVVPAEEAAQEFKEGIQSQLRALREQRQGFLESQRPVGRRSSFLETTRSEAAEIARGFEELHRFLKAQEHLLLTQLLDLERAVAREQKEAVAKVSEEMSHLDTLIWEMEGKFQQPATQFLQDIGRLLSSCEMMKFNPPAEVSSHLEQRLEDFLQRNVLVRGTLRRCQDNLMFKLQDPTNVTLDPATAHPNLLISDDLKEARGQLRPRNLPDNPERFNFEPCVLGSRGFTSGRHFWEVEVGQGGVWAIGVARESLKRKGPVSVAPCEGLWALETFHSLASPRANRCPRPLPTRLRVALDYEGRRVAFFSAAGAAGGGDTAAILVHTGAAFNGERVFPWFKLGLGARLLEVAQWPSREMAGGPLAPPLHWVGFGFPLRLWP